MSEELSVAERRRMEAELYDAERKRQRDIAKKVASLLAENKVTLAEMEGIIKRLRYLLEVSLPQSP